MSQDAATVQANLDQLTATVNSTLPQAVQTLNALFADWQALKNGAPSGLDPAKVQADVDAINSAVQGLSAAVTADTPPAITGSSTTTPPASSSTPSS